MAGVTEAQMRAYFVTTDQGLLNQVHQALACAQTPESLMLGGLLSRNGFQENTFASVGYLDATKDLTFPQDFTVAAQRGHNCYELTSIARMFIARQRRTLAPRDTRRATCARPGCAAMLKLIS